MAIVNWLQAILSGMLIGGGLIAYYDRLAPPSLPMTAAIVDAAIHLGWECRDSGTMTLDGCQQLAAGVQKIGD